LFARLLNKAKGKDEAEQLNSMKEEGLTGPVLKGDGQQAAEQPLPEPVVSSRFWRSSVPRS
jgi:hypothetical protein